MNVTVLDCPGKGWWLAFTSSSRTLCGPSDNPAMSTVLMPLASAHHRAHVVHVYVQMPDPRRYVEGALPEDRYDVQILHPPLDPDDAAGISQQLGKRVVDDQLGWSSHS